ncbi:hypothetical protein [Ferruginibacter sp. SUN106]|uniref:hypothetical protein n=1 Tax=Ferruginibacter sp. SUN106 TaxID=2978348 RepID=UPI003D35F5C5
MKKWLGSILFFSAVCSCNAQYKVQSAKAFFTSSMPGMQRVDANDNKIDPEPIIERFIFLETRFNGKPKIDTVWYNNILFSATIADKEEAAKMVGVKKNTGTTISLAPKKGNHFWRIDVAQADGHTLKHDAVKKIIIKGKLDKTKFSYTITTETELAAPDRY